MCCLMAGAGTSPACPGLTPQGLSVTDLLTRTRRLANLVVAAVVFRMLEEDFLEPPRTGLVAHRHFCLLPFQLHAVGYCCFVTLVK